MSEEVTSEHSGEYIRLVRLWQRRTRFSLIFAAVEDSSYRDTLIARLEKIAPSIRIDFDPDQEPLHLVTVLQNAHANGIHRAHICMKAGITIPALWWNKANVLRESMADALKGVLVFWLTDSNIQTAAHEAPDLWNWRETVLTFTAPTPVTFPSTIDGIPFDDIFSPEKVQIEERLAQIESYLSTQNEYDTTAAHLLLEAAYAYLRLGQLDKSESAARQSAKLFALDGNAALAAQAKGKIADVLKSRGYLDKALEIYKNEELPIYEQIGDARSIAVTKGRIADIYQTRGQLDEALAIRQNDELPVYKKIGDIRSVAVTKSKIADVHKMRGDLKKALAIFQKQVLPIFEQIGDMRESALTKNKIAHIYQLHGRLDEALSIYQNEVLPVYEALGDTHGVAMSKTKRAVLFSQQGRLEEAITSLQDEVLPILQQCGYEPDVAITQRNIAFLLAIKQQQEAAPTLRLQQFDHLLRRAIPAPPHRQGRR